MLAIAGVGYTHVAVADGTGIEVWTREGKEGDRDGLDVIVTSIYNPLAGNIEADTRGSNRQSSDDSAMLEVK